MKRKIIWEKWKNPFDEEVDEEIKKPLGKVLVGPMGVIPINDSNNPGKVFNFWILHCNFLIDDDIMEILRDIPGVESYEPFTRYRFRLSIGKAFDEKEVRMAVQKALCPRPPRANKIDFLKESLSSKYKHWAIFVFSNGEIEVAHGDKDEPIQEAISKHKGNKETQIFSSFDNGKTSS